MKQPLSNQQYDELVKQTSPNSKSYKTIPMAFLIGGLICVLGQLFADLYARLGLEQQFCYPAASCTLVLITAILTGLNVFDDLAKHAGAGTLVPITGFANSVASPALEFKAEGFVLGVGAKMFIIAGPVIVYGVAASVVYGIILVVFKLI